MSSTFINDVGRLLAETGIKPENLILELSADGVTADPDQTLGRVQILRDLGVKVAIDNFGMGAISLQGMHGHGFDLLKIDGRLVAEALTPSGRGIVNTIVQMSAAINVEVTANGIEHPDWIAPLRDMGMTLGQGFAIGRPVPRERIQSVVEAGWIEGDQFIPEVPTESQDAVAWLVEAMDSFS